MSHKLSYTARSIIGNHIHEAICIRKARKETENWFCDNRRDGNDEESAIFSSNLSKKQILVCNGFLEFEF